MKSINQSDIAAWLGVSQGHLSNILAGRKPLTINLMRTIKQKTGLSLDKIDQMSLDRIGDKLSKRYKKK